MGRMYVSSSPTRPIASWMVATPYFASAATLAASARRTCLTAIPDCPIMGSPFFCVDGWGYEDFAAHDEPRRAQQRRLQNLGRVGGVHAQNHAEFTARMFHRNGLRIARRDQRIAVRDAARHDGGGGDRHGAQYADGGMAVARNEGTGANLAAGLRFGHQTHFWHHLF